MKTADRSKFRADIQGLRGIAVLGVFFFHLGLAGVPGGYAGVDVFFVISGYLITGIIVTDIRAGTFSFAEFYCRRMKRILPAFHLVGLVTIVAGSFLLMPTSLTLLVKSLVASTLFASNIFFWKETTGYFGSASDELPLLHYWSLSVEEQFYLIWPLALVLLARTAGVRGRLPTLIVIAAAASFLVAEWGAGHSANAAYFLLPSRAGEFLLGGLLVFLPESPRDGRRFLPQAMAIAGLVLVLGSAVLLAPASRFPGLNALWPCLGAALLIATGRGGTTWVSSILGFRPLVAVGTISYSLYLWHWPPIAFLHYFNIELTALLRVALFAAVLVLAYLSWRFVEEVPRRMDWRLPRAVVTLGLLPLVLQISGYAVLEHRKTAFPSLAETPVLPEGCHEAMSASDYQRRCVLGDEGVAPTFALWGDSFAGVLATPVGTVARRDHVSGYLLSMSMCPSIHGIEWDNWDNPDFPKVCSNYTDRAYDFVMHHAEINTVILTSNYSWYLTGHNAAGHPIVSATQPRHTVVDEFRATLEELAAAGKKIVIVMPHTYDKVPFTATLRRAFVLGTTESATMERMSAQHPDAVTAMVEELAPKLGIIRIYPDKVMCSGNRCRLFDEDGDVELSDGAHLSQKTARRMLEQLPPKWYAVSRESENVDRLPEGQAHVATDPQKLKAAPASSSN